MTDEKQPGDESSSLLTDTRRMITQQLRKLQHHQHTNVEAEMAQKAKGAFNVSATDGSDTLSAHTLSLPISLMVYPQNPFVSEPGVREMSPTDLQPGLRNSRVWIRDSQYPAARPDGDNNYLYWKDTPEFNQVNAFYYVTLTLRMFEKFAHRQLAWAFTAPRVNVDPHAGVGMNAFYDEDNRTIGFYNFTQPDGELVNTAQSADVVAHEAGHAVLDGLRDLYNQSFGMGPMAFHESFADMSAVLVALQDDELVRLMLEWTENDLRVDNFVAAVAEHIIEQMMRAVSVIADLDERTIYLRNAINRFKYVPFDDLPYFAMDPRYELGRESHNYSRLFTGAFYDALVNIYEHVRDLHDTAPQIALHRARDVMGHLLVYAVECGPVGELVFTDMARAFLTADSLLHDGMYTPSLIEAFEGRDLLSRHDAYAHLQALKALPPLRLPDRVDSALEAGIFLVEQVVPVLGLPDEVDFTPMSAHRNQRGFAFLTYFCARSVILEGPQYAGFDGVAVDAFGGLSLAFDPDGMLRSALYRPVTDEDARRIQLLTSDLINHGLVTETTFAGVSRVLSDEIVTADAPSMQPRFLYLANALGNTVEGMAKLIRSPMIMDTVPHTPESLLSYLKEVLRRD